MKTRGTDRPGRSRTRLNIAVGGLCVGAILLLVPLPNVYRANWWSALQDLSHVPLFAMGTVCLWQIIPGGIVSAALAAIVLAGAAEVCQPATGRSMQLSDFAYGLAGIVAISIAAAGFQRTRSRGWRMACVAVASAVSLIPLQQSLPVLTDAWCAYRSFPVLADFESPSESLRWYQQSAIPLRNQDPYTGRWSGEIRLNAKQQDAILFPVVRDWRGWQRLYCEFSLEGDPVELLISIRDGHRVQAPLVRFDLVQQFPAGQHQVEIDLRSLARGDKFAPLDLARIQSFHLCVKGLRTERVIRLHRLYLNNGSPAGTSPDWSTAVGSRETGSP